MVLLYGKRRRLVGVVPTAAGVSTLVAFDGDGGVADASAGPDGRSASLTFVDSRRPVAAVVGFASTPTRGGSGFLCCFLLADATAFASVTGLRDFPMTLLTSRGCRSTCASQGTAHPPLRCPTKAILPGPLRCAFARSRQAG